MKNPIERRNWTFIPILLCTIWIMIPIVFRYPSGLYHRATKTISHCDCYLDRWSTKWEFFEYGCKNILWNSMWYAVIVQAQNKWEDYCTAEYIHEYSQKPIFSS